tara:strand:- start:260 stop:592 length:333 start_codon:yes stop_codon:yes gene_type:complete
MSTKWTEVRYGDYVYFKGKTGTGSVVKTESRGRFFMPAKIGMRIKGEKFPILKNERFILTNSKVLHAEGTDRIIKCFLTRCSDNTTMIISERQFQQYFYKTNQSNLGGPL